MALSSAIGDREGEIMPLLPMTEKDEVLRHEAFDDATRTLVCDAFNSAWLMMLAFDDPAANLKRYPEARALLARRIIGRARMGERDLDALRWDAVQYVRATLTPDYPKG